MFTASCRGKDGKLWCLHIPVDTWEAAENIIEQLGLEVESHGLGELLEEIPVADAEVQYIQEALVPAPEVMTH